MRPLPPPVLRPVLLVALTALLAACGGSQTDERKFIAQSRAERLLRSVDRVETALNQGECEQAADDASRLRSQVSDLPESYDGRLVSNLTQWVDHLDARVQADCTAAEEEPTPTPTPTEEAPEEETPTPTPTPTEDAPEETPTPTPSATATPAPTVPAPEPQPPSTGGVAPDEQD